MSNKIFNSRDDTINTIVSNLVWADILQPSEVKNHMKLLNTHTDNSLAEILLQSCKERDSYLDRYAYLRRN